MKWIDIYNQLSDMNSKALNGEFFECHVGGIGTFNKSTNYKNFVIDCPIDDLPFFDSSTLFTPANTNFLLKSGRDWTDPLSPYTPTPGTYDPDKEWVGYFGSGHDDPSPNKDINYWMGLEIAWGDRGFLITYNGGDKNDITGYWGTKTPTTLDTLPEITDGYRLTNLDNFLSEISYLLNIVNFDSSNVISMEWAFYNKIINSYDASNPLITSSCEDFYNVCRGTNFINNNINNASTFLLKDLTAGKNFNYAFANISGKNINYIKFNIPNAENTASMFVVWYSNDYPAVEPILDNTNIILIKDLSNLTDANHMYSDAKIGDLTNYEFKYDTDKVDCSTFISITKEKYVGPNPFTIKLGSEYHKFTQHPIEFSNKELQYKINGGENLTDITFNISELSKNFVDIDLSHVINIDIGNVNLFGGVNVDSTYVKPTYDLSNCKTFNGAFQSLHIYDLSTDTEITNIDNYLPKLINVDNITSAKKCYYGTTSIHELTVPFTNVDCNLSSLVYNCSELTKIILPRTDMIETAAGNFSYMFYGCEKLTDIVDSSNNEVTMKYLFELSKDLNVVYTNCKSLKNIKLEFLNVPDYTTQAFDENLNRKINVNFYGCENLETIEGDLYGCTCLSVYPSASGRFATDFSYCTKLREVTFKEIVTGIYLLWSKNLSDASLNSLFAALKHLTPNYYSYVRKFDIKLHWDLQTRLPVINNLSRFLYGGDLYDNYSLTFEIPS